MTVPAEIVLQTDRHLKWRAFDRLEHALMLLCGLCLAGFTIAVFLDVLTRQIGHPWLWLQEVTSTFFTYGVFVGTAVATRRNDHLYLSAITEAMTGRTREVFEVFNRTVVLLVGLAMVVFGWENFLTGFGSFRMPSMLPIAYLYAPIPVAGALVALFSLEQIVNGLRNGFVGQAPPASPIRGDI
jgi:TRAP-type C4-dicarboxylate transport system permease small subunit